jgi:hypothetical protein
MNNHFLHAILSLQPPTLNLILHNAPFQVKEGAARN